MKNNLDQKILTNMLNELNMCVAKRSVLRAKGLSSSKVTERIEYLEKGIAVQRKKIEDKEK